MALRNILTVTEDEKLLRRKAKEVTEFDKRLCELIEDMTETMINSDGIGIAAPQIGILKRVVICNIDDKIYELVNPKIIKVSDETAEDVEGCLSVPGKRGYVVRPQQVTVKAQDKTGKTIMVTGKGYGARVLCHEIDHLDGILYTDKAKNMYNI